MFNSIPIILNLLTNRNIALIYSVTICEQKTKDCGWSGNFQHKLQHCCFQLWCLLAFLTSLLYKLWYLIIFLFFSYKRTKTLFWMTSFTSSWSTLAQQPTWRKGRSLAPFAEQWNTVRLRSWWETGTLFELLPAMWSIDLQCTVAIFLFQRACRYPVGQSNIFVIKLIKLISRNFSAMQGLSWNCGQWELHYIL